MEESGLRAAAPDWTVHCLTKMQLPNFWDNGPIRDLDGRDNGGWYNDDDDGMTSLRSDRGLEKSARKQRSSSRA